MRVSTATLYATTIANLQTRQSDLSRSQAQMTSGKRVSQLSDDPTAAAQAERAHIAQQRIASEQRSVEASRSAMTLAESALGQIGDVLHSAREVMVNAGNASYGPGERSALTMQLQQLRGQLLALANQHDGAGAYTFGGQGGNAAPFLDTPGGMVYAGTGGQASVSSSEQMPTAVDGQSIWLSARSGNGVYVTSAAPANTGQAWIDAGGVSNPAALTGANYDVVFSVSGGGAMVYDVLKDGLPTAVVGAAYNSGTAITVDGLSFNITGAPAAGDRFSTTPSTASLNPFAALDRATAALQNANATQGQTAQAVSDGLRDLDAVMSHMQSARSGAGAALSRLDSIESRDQDRTLWAKSVQSSAEDLDMVQAVSNFQNQQSGYQAALQTYAMVQRLSLFEYLR